MYTDQVMLESIKKVEASRPARVGVLPERLTAEQKEAVLSQFHPDYKQEGFEILQVGPNKGEKVPTELAALLQANSRVKDLEVDLNQFDYDVDVLVIGGGMSYTFQVAMGGKVGRSLLDEERIGLAKELIEEAESIEIETSEVKKVHEIYLDAINKNNQAFTLMLSALENQDYPSIIAHFFQRIKQKMKEI